MQTTDTRQNWNPLNQDLIDIASKLQQVGFVPPVRCEFYKLDHTGKDFWIVKVLDSDNIRVTHSKLDAEFTWGSVEALLQSMDLAIHYGGGRFSGGRFISEDLAAQIDNLAEAVKRDAREGQ